MNQLNKKAISNIKAVPVIETIYKLAKISFLLRYAFVNYHRIDLNRTVPFKIGFLMIREDPSGILFTVQFSHNGLVQVEFCIPTSRFSDKFKKLMIFPKDLTSIMSPAFPHSFDDDNLFDVDMYSSFIVKQINPLLATIEKQDITNLLSDNEVLKEYKKYPSGGYYQLPQKAGIFSSLTPDEYMALEIQIIKLLNQYLKQFKRIILEPMPPQEEIAVIEQKYKAQKEEEVEIPEEDAREFKKNSNKQKSIFQL